MEALILCEILLMACCHYLTVDRDENMRSARGERPGTKVHSWMQAAEAVVSKHDDSDYS